MHNLGRALVGALAVILSAAVANAADIKIGVLKTVAAGPLYVAKERGYFAAEGINAQIVFFDAGVLLTTGVVTGDIDFGDAALIAATYNLGAQGALRLIAGGVREVPGFQDQAFLVSDKAYAAGLTTLKGFGGHSFAVSQLSGPAQYVLGRLAQKYDFSLATVRVIATQSLSNAIAALVGGQADTTIISMTPTLPALLERGQAKFLGWVGDEIPWQNGAVFVSSKTADGKRDLVEGFLRAYRHGAHDYHDAFTSPAGDRRDGPTAPDILPILAKFTGQSMAQVRSGISYIDADGRLDVRDVLRQIAWYKAQSVLKAGLDGDAILDRRYIVALPAP